MDLDIQECKTFENKAFESFQAFNLKGYSTVQETWQIMFTPNYSCESMNKPTRAY